MDVKRLKDNLQEVQTKISESAMRAGRSPKEVTLVAVTKTVSAQVIEALAALGVENIGENRVQAAKLKKKLLCDCPLKWHMIGHLQRKKVKDALAVFSFSHSVDTMRLAEKIDKYSEMEIPVLLEVNISGEDSKYGFSEDQLEREIERIATFSKIRVCGLMSMAPFTAKVDKCKGYFCRLRCLLEKLQKNYPSLQQLSMGMSRDYQVAVEEGATLVRVGTALFRGI